MSDFAARRALSKEGRFHTVKTGFKQTFSHQGLAAKVQEAVQLVTPILTEGSLLANHVLRCIQSGKSLSINQTFWNCCYSAVSYATGNKAQEFDPAKDPSLAASYELYRQSLPALHRKPETPHLHQRCKYFYQRLIGTLTMSLLLYIQVTTMMTSQPADVLQACNAAAQMAQVNYTNSIASNFRPRTKRFIRLEIAQIAHFTQMPDARVTSCQWVNLLYRAASEESNVSKLLPIYTSLVQPPDDVLELLEYMVTTWQALMGPFNLSVTDQTLERKPESYLSWMQLVLTAFQAAQGTPYAPKLFSMMPQKSHQTS